MQLLPFPIGTTCDSRNVHQPGANGIDHKLSCFVNSQSVHDVGAVNGHRVGTQVKSGGNFLVGFAINNHLQNFEFAVGQLEVRDVIVCGHSSCGAMSALLRGREDVSAPHLRSWLRHAERAGFVHEGARRLAYWRHGEWVDGVLYGLVREDLEP